MNLPNKISLSRIIFTPLIIIFYLLDFRYGKFISALLFILLAGTDFIDGNIARKRNMVTDLGKFLDETADKLLNTSALILVVADGTIPHPFGVIVAIIILIRDQIVGFIRRFAVKNNVVIPANKWGKLKTIMQDIMLPMLMLLASNSYLNVIDGVILKIYTILTFTIVGIATILTIISGIIYVVQNKDYLK